MVDPEKAIPIHFKREVEAAALKDRIQYLRRGGTYTFRVAPGDAVAGHATNNMR
jgi:hypothetical protein